MTHCPQKCVRKEISRPGFLCVSRWFFKKTIDLRRGFLCYVNISIRIFGDNGSFPGSYGGLYRQNLPYKFKNSYGDLQNHNFEKIHRTTGPRSDLIPDSWSCANSGLKTTFGINRKKLGGHQGHLNKRTVIYIASRGSLTHAAVGWTLLFTCINWDEYYAKKFRAFP